MTWHINYRVVSKDDPNNENYEATYHHTFKAAQRAAGKRKVIQPMQLTSIKAAAKTRKEYQQLLMVVKRFGWEEWLLAEHVGTSNRGKIHTYDLYRPEQIEYMRKLYNQRAFW